MTLTRDGIFDSRITVYQPRRGYRFNVDSVLLGCFAIRGRPGRALDLGSGSGVVGLILLELGGAREVIGVEIDPTLAEASLRSARDNGLEDRFRVVQGDLRERSTTGGLDDVDLVVSNPPYRESGTGREPPDEGRARARHERTCTLADVVETAARTLRHKGRLCVVLPPGRLADLVRLASPHRLHLSRLGAVHPRIDRPASMVLVEARLGASPRGCAVEPPTVLHDERGRYTPAVEDLLRRGPPDARRLT
jgi:tRNA1Val (adenine37-N6)-methyltransferase